MTNTEETLTDAAEEVEALNRQPSGAVQIVATRSGEANHPAAMEDGTRNQVHPDKADAALSQFHERAISEVRGREQASNDPPRYQTTSS